MTTKTTYVATAPDGTEITRTSTSRTYTHAVLARDERGWGRISFNGSEGLALKEAEKWRGRFPDLAVVEVWIAGRREVGLPPPGSNVNVGTSLPNSGTKTLGPSGDPTNLTGALIEYTRSQQNEHSHQQNIKCRKHFQSVSQIFWHFLCSLSGSH